MTSKVIEIKNSRKAQEIQDWAAQNCSMFYRAPELFNPKVGSSIDESADVWSLGCVLYALMFVKIIYKFTNFEINLFIFYSIEPIKDHLIM